MSLVVESVSAVAGGSNSVTITKPSGVAVGDLLVSVLSTIDSGGGTVTGSWVTLSGWTEATGGNFTYASMSIQYRVATAADVSASNYTFSHSDTEVTRGYIIRCSGNNTVDGGLGLANKTGETYSAYTPPEDGALVIMQPGFRSTNVSTSAQVSAYTVAGVSFSEQFDLLQGDGTPASLIAAAHGIQTTSTEIATYNATFSVPLGGVSSTYYQFAVFNPPIDATGTNTLATTTSEAFTQSGTCDVTGTTVLTEATSEAFTQSGRGEAPTQWTNETKPSTTWTNET